MNKVLSAFGTRGVTIPKQNSPAALFHEHFGPHSFTISVDNFMLPLNQVQTEINIFDPSSMEDHFCD